MTNLCRNDCDIVAVLHRQLAEAKQELQEYKEAEKEGRLCVSPLCEGEKYYTIGYNCEIQKREVMEHKWGSAKFSHGKWMGYDSETGQVYFDESHFFFTREAAEAALAEAEG